MTHHAMTQTLDDFVSQYKEKISERYQEASSLPASYSLLSQSEMIREKLSHDFLKLRSDFHDAIGTLESRFIDQYQQFLQLRHVSERERTRIEELYHIESIFHSLSVLEQKQRDMEDRYHADCKRLLKAFEDKKVSFKDAFLTAYREMEIHFNVRKASLKKEISSLEQQLLAQKMEIQRHFNHFLHDIESKKTDLMRQLSSLQQEYDARRNVLEQEEQGVKARILSVSQEMESLSVALNRKRETLDHEFSQYRIQATQDLQAFADEALYRKYQQERERWADEKAELEMKLRHFTADTPRVVYGGKPPFPKASSAL